MNDTDEHSLHIEQEPMNLFHVTISNGLLFSMGNFTENFLVDKPNNKTHLPNLPLSGLTYAIISGLICACLCFLTITGNLLVLITFRRVRTVSIELRFAFYF